jgi:hypothetical protein
MTEHSFTLVFTMSSNSLESHLDDLFEAGCDDATFAGPAPDNTFVADFDREAPAFAIAVVSAMRALRRVLPGVHLLRLEPDDLVSQSAIAERLGRSAESVRMLIAGHRGPGAFPPPVAAINHKTQVWSWALVSHWFRETHGVEIEGDDNAQWIAALNVSLFKATIARHLPTPPADANLIFELEQQELAAS